MKEIQVLVNFGGYGYNLFPYSERTHKHLLPVANKPILAYVLEKLNSHYFTDFVFICNGMNRDSIEFYINNKFQWGNKYQVHYQFYNSDHYQDISQVIASLLYKKILQRDFILIQGDCVTECNLNDLVDFHYQNQFSVTSVYSEQKNSKTILLMDENEKKLLRILDQDQKMVLKFNEAFIKNNPTLKVKKNVVLNDIHICDFRIAKIVLKTFQKFSEFQEETLPFMIKNQFNKKLAQVYH